MEMLQDLEEQEMLDWDFKKLHVRTILRKAHPSVSVQPSSVHGSSSGLSSEGVWNDGQYRKVRKLGEGGFGCAFLVRDSEQGNTQLVLKEIRSRTVLPTYVECMSDFA